MNWQDEIRAEFIRLGKTADAAVIEEMAQHAHDAFDAAQADGMAVAEAEASVRDLIRSWCAGTTGPRRAARSPLLEASSGA
jgi:hypothetical protein